MEEQPATPAVQSGLRFESFQVTQVEMKTDPAASTAGTLNYTVNFQPAGRLSWAQGAFILLLSVNVTAENALFEATVQTRGVFSFDAAQNVEQLNNLLLFNTPALVFPYVRAYIGALTALSGLPTVLAPTFNLTSLAEPLRQAIVEVDEV